MNVNEMFPGQFLKAQDLEGNEVKVIDNITQTKFDDGDKFVVNFNDGTALVLNKTNANRIAELHGPDTNQWPHEQITLFSDRVEFMGSMVDGIRVKIGDTNSTTTEAVDCISDTEAGALFRVAREDNGWPKPEIQRIVKELCGASSMNRIPKDKMEMVSTYLGEKYKADVNADDIPF
jgi:hypothetical protein